MTKDKDIASNNNNNETKSVFILDFLRIHSLELDNPTLKIIKRCGKMK